MKNDAIIFGLGIGCWFLISLYIGQVGIEGVLGIVFRIVFGASIAFMLGVVRWLEVGDTNDR